MIYRDELSLELGLIIPHQNTSSTPKRHLLNGLIPKTTTHTESQPLTHTKLPHFISNTLHSYLIKDVIEKFQIRPVHSLSLSLQAMLLLYHSVTRLFVRYSGPHLVAGQKFW